MPIDGLTNVERRALEIWRAREQRFPKRVQRMNPDDFDRASRAWRAVLAQARRELDDERSQRRAEVCRKLDHERKKREGKLFA
jgi:hypothetical protein